MTTAKKIQITTEIHETFTLHIHSRGRAFGFCRECEREVEVVTLEQAVWMTRIHTREMLGMIDEQTVHATETENGLFLICVNSISNHRALARSSNES